MGVIQVIFVVETSKNKKTDDRYIDKLVKAVYDSSSNDIKFQYVHMGGKTKYNKENVQKDINSFIKQNKDGINHVLYCFDTDRIDNNPEEVKKLQIYENYCKENGYHFVWFCSDIETVFLGRSVPDSEKETESKKFGKKDFELTKSMVKRMSEKNNDNKTKKNSNILFVLNSILSLDIFKEK